MEVNLFLIQLVVILFFARFIGELLAFLKMPPVIGELLAGLLIGPSVLGWVRMSNPIHLLSEIGVILLLFEVGLETNIKKLSSNSLKAISVALCGVIFPFFLGFFVCYYLFHFAFLVSVFVGSTLTATSIGITLRVLKDLQKQASNQAQIILGAAILDDITGIILLAVLYEFSTTQTINVFHAIKTFCSIILFFLIAPFIGKLLSLFLKKWEQKSTIPGLLPATMVALILSFAWLADLLGAPLLLGGFAAGLAFSKHFFKDKGGISTDEFNLRVQNQMKPIVHLFAPIFFVSVGLSLNFKTVNWSSSNLLIMSLLLMIAAILGKFLAGIFLRKESFLSKGIIGLAMVPRGEIGLVFANIGLTTKIFNQEIYTVMIIVIGITTMLAPIGLKALYKLAPTSS